LPHVSILRKPPPIAVVANWTHGVEIASSQLHFLPMKPTVALALISEGERAAKWLAHDLLHFSGLRT
jgi:hypothetical protein